MPIREGFDCEAMERKIEKNLEKHHTIRGIKLALMEELKETLESIQIKEARAAELNDQISYMEKHYA